MIMVMTIGRYLKRVDEAIQEAKELSQGYSFFFFFFFTLVQYME